MCWVKCNLTKKLGCYMYKLFFPQQIEDMEEEKKNIDELKSITKETLAAVANDLKPADTSEVQYFYLGCF